MGVGTHVFVPTGEGEGVKVGRGVREGRVVGVFVGGADVKVKVGVRVGVTVRLGVIVGGTGEGDEVRVGLGPAVMVAVPPGVIVGGKGDGDGVNVHVLVGDGTNVGGGLSKAPDNTH